MNSRSLDGRTRVYGVVGHPVAHSLSPAMHNAAFSELEVNAIYVAFPSTPEQVSRMIEGVRAMNVSGVNVTVPHKSAVLPFLDEVTPLAQKVGAVNTIRNDQGRLVGTNTDVGGFLRSLESLEVQVPQARIALLGAGGSARALLVGLADAGASRIWICNRTTERARQLIHEFQEQFPGTDLQVAELEALHAEPWDLLVNTTTVGMEHPESPVDLHAFQEVRYLADIIYKPAQTLLLQQAEQLRIPSINGLGMLLYQGAEAFTFWTGLKAPTGVMRDALLSRLQDSPPTRSR